MFCTPIAEVTPILPDLPRLPAISLQQIAELEREIDRLQRTEEAIVVATGAPRERGCPPWVVLGVKAVETRGIGAA